MREITAERLRELLEYDPETGIFRWLARPSNCVHIGDIAGSKTAKGYIELKADGIRFYAHRLAFVFMTGELPPEDTDHINGNKSDNRWANLRAVSRQVNMQNLRKANKNNQNGLLGVKSRGNRFTATIMIDGKSKWLGTYDTPEEAHQMYLKTKRTLHSEGCAL